MSLNGETNNVVVSVDLLKPSKDGKQKTTTITSSTNAANSLRGILKKSSTTDFSGYAFYGPKIVSTRTEDDNPLFLPGIASRQSDAECFANWSSRSVLSPAPNEKGSDGEEAEQPSAAHRDLLEAGQDVGGGASTRKSASTASSPSFFELSSRNVHLASLSENKEFDGGYSSRSSFTKHGQAKGGSQFDRLSLSTVPSSKFGEHEGVSPKSENSSRRFSRKSTVGFDDTPTTFTYEAYAWSRYELEMDAYFPEKDDDEEEEVPRVDSKSSFYDPSSPTQVKLTDEITVAKSKLDKSRDPAPPDAPEMLSA